MPVHVSLLDFVCVRVENTFLEKYITFLSFFQLFLKSKRI